MEQRYLQSARKSESPRINPMYDVPIARNENASTIGCKPEDMLKLVFVFQRTVSVICMNNLNKYLPPLSHYWI
jgi:hypothetical protein